MPKAKRPSVKMKCEGEAHSNPYIDNCMGCMPYWGYYYACPECTAKLDQGGTCRNPECTSGGKRFIVPSRTHGGSRST